MKSKPVVAIIVNPRHGDREYKHKFGSLNAIDRYMTHPDRVHLKLIEVRQYDASRDNGIPFSLK